MRFLSFAEGKKTYALVAAGVALGIVQGLNDSGVVQIHLPGAVDWVLLFLGLGAARAGIQTQSAKTTADVVALVKDVLANIAIPDPPAVDPNTGLTGVTIRDAPIAVHALPPAH